MGLASSAEAELAVVGMRATGAVFGTAALMNGDPIWAWVLFALAQFVILYPLGIPIVGTQDGLTGYFITWPLIALGFALLGMLQFWLFWQGELMPWGRNLASVLGVNYGPKASWVAVIINTIAWAVVTVGAEIVYEWFIFSDVILASVLVCVIPAVGYLVLWIIYACLLKNHNAIFGSDRHVLRSIITPGAYHVFTNIVMAIVVAVAIDTYNVAWIVAIVILGLLVIVTLIVYFCCGRGWSAPTVIKPPRTGDVTFYTGKGSASAADTDPLVSSEDLESRFNMPAANIDGGRNSTSVVFNKGD